ncbi:MAG: hypothetical protein FJW96_14950 [Actinobacteria bacterium]|nr:hypothetical protein [Actinomycetota bacterium]
MLPALASVSALEARLGVTLAGVDAERASAALDDASALIRAEAGTDWLDDEGALTGVPPVVEQVALAVAYRTFRNPDAFTQTSLGDASVAYDRSGQSAVYLSREERRAVRRAAGATAVGAIELASPWAVPASTYPAPVAGGGDPIPLGPFPWESTR